MVYVIKEPAGSYFVEPSRISWDLSKDLNDATRFNTLDEAEEMKKTLDSAVAGTYWDYEDIVPFPTIVEINHQIGDE